jgi:shikimate kinase
MQMKNIVLIGFMGVGKTSTGKLLAAKLGLNFIDLDAKIEADNKKTIAEIFAEGGEEYFRDKETAAVAEAAKWSSTVISTGGGVVIREKNMELLRKNGRIIALTAPLDVIVERTGRNDDRPLLKEENRRKAAEKLLKSREELYKNADYSIDTGSRSPLQVVEEISEFLKRKGDLRA